MQNSARLMALLCSSMAGAALAVEFADSEKAWLDEHPVVRVGHVADFGPFSFVDARGTCAGLNTDTLEVVATKSGLRFECVVMPNLDAAFTALKERRVDLVMGIGRQPQREAFMRYTVPFAYSPDASVTRSDAPFLFDLRALHGQRVGVTVTSTTAIDGLRAQEAEVVTFASMPVAVRAVSRGDVFAAITDASIAAFTAKQERLTNLRIGGVFGFGDVHVGVRPDFGPLVSVLDKVFASMTAAERTQISNRWVVLDYESDRRWERMTRVLMLVLTLGVVIGAFVVWNSRRRARDLAVLTRMQAELEAARDALEQVNRGKSGLMQMMAHDLRNPLTAISLGLDAMELSSPEPDPIVREMRLATQRMRSMLDTLVEVQAIEQGSRSYLREPVSLIDVARTATHGMNEAAAWKQVHLRFSANAELPTLRSDEAALRQAIENLLSNAIKYSPSESEVHVEVSGDDCVQRVAVRDQGPGIAEAERARLFGQYVRGSARPTGGEKSTGLGLWIVHQIALGLDAEVRCESEPGRGSTFILEFPRSTRGQRESIRAHQQPSS
ncbi:MAG: hypothetical protein DI536_05270 [Archangium gephyra]|uniref:histidine kinase n=1 Tax=Archangium gephyra TaxID=48 RepID=A0A2W5TRP5_9BACT|nr:MAG: hypothetical protein DI536_05270 [Archangium gephyra]